MSTPRDAMQRRTRYGSMSVVLTAGATIALLFAAALLSRFHLRWDATATREHTLSARTMQTLASLTEPVEIVVSADPARMDARSRQRVGDVLAAFAGAKDSIRVTSIDVAGPNAAQQIDAVAARSLERNSDAVAKHHAAREGVLAALESIRRDAPPLADRLDAVGTPMDARLPLRERLLECAAVLRGLAGDAERATATITSEASVRLGDVEVPDAERIRTAAEQVLRNVATTGERAAASSVELPADARDAASAAAALRDRALGAADGIARLEPLEPLMIAKLLRGKPAVLIITSNGVQAIDQASLFPTTARLDAAGASGAQIAFAGEEIIAGALAAAASGGRSAPVLVLVHAEKESLLDAQRRPTTAGARLARMVERLGARGIDVAEWAVAKDANRPNLAAIDRNRSRPVVWFVLGAPNRLSEKLKPGESSTRAADTRSLATALESLVNGGEHLLIAMEPSEAPAIGEADPMLPPLTALGVSVDTARPLVERIAAPTAAAFSAYQTIRSAVGESDVGRAIGAMATTLQWPMPIRLESAMPPGVSVTPLLRVDASPNRWAESQWLGLRYLNVTQPLKAVTPRDPPTPGDRDDAAGPWAVAAVIERVRSESEPVAGGGHVQRAVLVASPSWYEDMYSELATMVEGRRVSVLPGNRELIDASVMWLAGRGELLEGSAGVGDVARIAPLSAAQLSAIRWALIAGMPGLVLAVGLFLRWRSGRSH